MNHVLLLLLAAAAARELVWVSEWRAMGSSLCNGPMGEEDHRSRATARPYLPLRPLQLVTHTHTQRERERARGSRPSNPIASTIDPIHMGKC